MTTMLLVLSGLCLVSVLAWRTGAMVAAPVGATAAVAASFLKAPAGPWPCPSPWLLAWWPRSAWPPRWGSCTLRHRNPADQRATSGPCFTVAI